MLDDPGYWTFVLSELLSKSKELAPISTIIIEHLKQLSESPSTTLNCVNTYNFSIETRTGTQDTSFFESRIFNKTSRLRKLLCDNKYSCVCAALI